MERVTITAIVVTYYTGVILEQCIDTLLSVSVDEVIVINNGNEDKFNRYLDLLDQQNKIRLLQGQGNVGFAKACNLGAKESSCELLLFVNPDLVVNEKAISSLKTSYLKKANKKAVFSPLICDSNGIEQRGCRRNLLTPKTLLLEVFFPLKFIPYFKVRSLNLDTLCPKEGLLKVKASSGACFLMERTFYHSLGGFDEAYFLHVEDLDLFYRVFEAKGLVYLDFDAQVYHQLSSSQVSSQFIEKHKYNGFNYYFNKFFPKTMKSPLGWFLKCVIKLNYYYKSCRF